MLFRNVTPPHPDHLLHEGWDELLWVLRCNDASHATRRSDRSRSLDPALALVVRDRWPGRRGVTGGIGVGLVRVDLGLVRGHDPLDRGVELRG